MQRELATALPDKPKLFHFTSMNNRNILLIVVLSFSLLLDMRLQAADIPFTELQGHSGWVYSVAFSPDGKRVVTASRDNTAQIWEADTGKELHKLEGHRNWVFSVVFSIDGKKIATASFDRTARIWDADSGKELQRLEGHESSVESVVFSPDSKSIATVSADKTARIWDAESGRELQKFEGHTHRIFAVAFSPDGKRLATGSEDRTVRIWDASSGRELQKLEGHESWVFSVAFSPDGKRIVTGSEDETARIWDADSGREIQKCEGHGSRVRTVVFSSDGKQIATASADNTARIWDVSSGMELQKLEGHQGYVRSVAFSKDGMRIATASEDLSARIWDISGLPTPTTAETIEETAVATITEPNHEHVTEIGMTPSVETAEVTVPATISKPIAEPVVEVVSDTTVEPAPESSITEKPVIETTVEPVITAETVIDNAISTEPATDMQTLLARMASLESRNAELTEQLRRELEVATAKPTDALTSADIQTLLARMTSLENRNAELTEQLRRELETATAKPTDALTSADIQVLLDRIKNLESRNTELAAQRRRELETVTTKPTDSLTSADMQALLDRIKNLESRNTELTTQIQTANTQVQPVAPNEEQQRLETIRKWRDDYQKFCKPGMNYVGTFKHGQIAGAVRLSFDEYTNPDNNTVKGTISFLAQEDVKFPFVVVFNPREEITVTYPVSGEVNFNRGHDGRTINQNYFKDVYGMETPEVLREMGELFYKKRVGIQFSDRMIFSLGEYASSAGRVTFDVTQVPEPRFGVRAANHTNGVQVTQVLQISPGQRAGFEVGDVITEINGASIRNEQDYSDAIDRAGRFSRMKVIRVRTGQTADVDVILNE